MPLAGSNTVTTTALVWAPVLPWPWLLAAGTGLFLACLASVAWASRGAPERRATRWAAALARAVASAALLATLAGPTLQRERGRPEPRQLLLVVDNSQSMALPAAHHPSGAAATRAVVERLLAHPGPVPVALAQLQGPCGDAAACAVPALGHSDLLGALEGAANRGGPALAGVVLVSDGVDTTRTGEAGSALSEEDRRRLHGLAVPISTVATGSPHAFDVRLAEVAQDPLVFVKTTVEIDCVVALSGTVTGPLNVELWRGATRLAERTLAVPPKAQQLHARFPLRIDAVGEQAFRCRVRPLAGERTPANNERAFVVRALRDKVRVLHVAGRPSFDERFLRQQLKDNPNLEVVSFFILRTPHSDSAVPESELSLIPFPVGRLFTEELRNFDVVVLQNFDFRPYQMSHYLENLRRAVVEQGLGLVMLGGEESFAGGGYGGTPLEHVLPLQLGEAQLAGGAGAPVAAWPRLTAAGRSHPLLALRPGERGAEADRAAAVRLLPALDHLNLLGASRAGAQVLLEAGLAGAPGAETAHWPLWAAMDVGRGRSLAVATDASWRWAYTPLGTQDAPQLYAQLWHNAWRWLTHDPELGRLRLWSAQPAYDAGAEGAVATGEVRVLDADWRPAAAAALRVVASPLPDAMPLASAQGASRPTLAEIVQHVRAGAEGRAAYRLGPLAAGVWRVCAERVEATAPRTPSAAGGASDADADDRDCTLLVVHAGPEAQLTADGDGWLAALAREGGGVATDAQRAARGGWQPVLADAPPLRVESRERRSLADHPALLALLTLSYGTAFFLTRRAGGR